MWVFTIIDDSSLPENKELIVACGDDEARKLHAALVDAGCMVRKDKR